MSIGVNLSVAVCFSCDLRSIWRGFTRRVPGMPGGYVEHEMLYPKVDVEGPASHSDLPEHLLPLYEEARGVLAVSPRAASALVRLTLEGVLSDLYSGTLNEMIGAASAAGLSPEVVQAMDVLRFAGNQSIHEVRPDDTLETATALFHILNLVVERLITQPKQIAEMHAALPPSVRAAIEKRDSAK